MKPYLLFLMIVLAIITMPLADPAMNNSWYSFGLENQNVRCILADDTSLVLAGVDSGVYVRYAATWHRFSGYLIPCNALIRISTDKVIAAIGGGAKEDGIYLLTKIRREPYYQLQFSRFVYVPLSLALQQDTLFIGSGNSLYRLALSDTVSPSGRLPDLIKTPDNPFGNKSPISTSLIMFMGSLYAGGYSESPQPSPSHLLVKTKDSMVFAYENTMNVSAMAIVNMSVEGLGQSSLAIGTVDSGIYMYYPPVTSPPPTKSWIRSLGPKGRPIYAMMAIPSPLFDELLVAVDSGVFLGHSDTWTEVGDIPASPHCLAMFGNSSNSYLAETEKGVYRYEIGPAGVRSVPLMKHEIGLQMSVSFHKTKLRLDLTVNRKGPVTLCISDISGRLIRPPMKMHFNVGKHSIDVPVGTLRTGIYVVTLSDDNGGRMVRTFFCKA